MPFDDLWKMKGWYVLEYVKVRKFVFFNMKHTLYEYRYVSDQLHATYFQGKYDSITKISKIISFAQLAFCYPA